MRFFRAPRFNDDFYCKSIAEWEDRAVPERAVSSGIQWSITLLPVALIVGSATGPNSWLTWGAIFAVEFVVVGLFMLLDEVNENVRFVRHQLGALRFAVRRVGAGVASYKDPVANFALSDAVTALNREWEDPK